MRSPRFQKAGSRFITSSALGVFSAAAFAIASLNANAFVDIPNPAPVVDLTGSLNSQQQQALTTKIVSLDQQTGTEVEMLVLPTTGDETVQSYSWRVAETWRPGHQGVNRGLVVVVAKNDHKSYIQVGRGLEAVLPSEQATEIAKSMSPSFRAGDFYGGLDHALDEVSARVTPVQVAPPAATASEAAVQTVAVPKIDIEVSRSVEKPSVFQQFADNALLVPLLLLVLPAGFLIAYFFRQNKKEKNALKGYHTSTSRSSQGASASTAQYTKASAPVDPKPATNPATTASNALFEKDFEKRAIRSENPAPSPTPSRTVSTTPTRKSPVSRPTSSSISSSSSRAQSTFRSHDTDDGFAAGYVAGSLSRSRDDDYYSRNSSSSRSSSSSSSTSSTSDWSSSSSSSSDWSSSSSSYDSGGSFGGSGGGDSW